MLVRARSVALFGACLLLLVTCVGTSTVSGGAGPAPRGEGVAAATAMATATAAATVKAAVERRAATRAAASGSTVLADAAPEVTAVAVSRYWWGAAPVVVVAPGGDPQTQLTAASVAVQVGAPLLLTGPGVAPDVAGFSLPAELARLGAVQVLTAGAVDPAALGTAADRPTVLALPTDASALARLVGTPVTAATVPAGGEVAAVLAIPDRVATPSSRLGTARPGALLPDVSLPDASVPGAGAVPHAASVLEFDRASPLADAVQLTDGSVSQLAALATARAAGVRVVVVPGGDPRATPAVVQELAAARPEAVLGVGSSFGAQGTFATRVAVASTGVELPGGGQTITPGKRYVALYGTPGTASLGVLGEQDVPATVARAEAMAAPYRSLTTDAVVPTVEIIATIASGGPGPDGNYSQERSVAELRPLVDAAHAAGMYVVLDLQPGRTDFLTQAQQYAELLSLPNVGLALDPEWRLAPDQVHLKQIGSVSIEEVNAVVTWLADLTRDRALPQKLLILHQFAARMIVGIDRLDTSRDELALMIHVDGQGTQPAKAGTWAALRAAAPNVGLWGWKNFIDEDLPMLDPAQTYQVQPTPTLVTYQ